MTCTVEITLHALSQRSPAESIGKGQKLIEAARPEGAEALSPGQRPGLSCSQTWRPVRAKALKLTLKFIKLLPLQGALLTVTIPRAMPWAKSFCPFRACWLYPLPWAKSFCPFRRAAYMGSSSFIPFLNHMRKFYYYISIKMELF